MRHPTRLRRRFVERCKRALVEANRSASLRFAGERAYDAMRLVITQRLASVHGVRSVYLCHSLAMGECYPGLSDFDMAIVFDGRDPLDFYERMRKRWGLLKRYFPVSDLSILTAGEFEAWQRIGGGWDPLDEVRHWKLLAGDELRRSSFDASAEEASIDRMQWSLGHFQNLLGVVLKEEHKSPLMAIVARRQLHKCFWNCVLALDPSYLALPTHRDRVTAWMTQNGTPAAVKALQSMYDARFMSGPVTAARFETAALAYRLLDESFALNPILARPLYRPRQDGSPIPIGNHEILEERARALCASLLEITGDSIESVIVGSTGSSRGYALHVVLRDGLSHDQLVNTLRDIRAVFRVFDDPWFNEHVPAGIPTISSRSMFLARLQTGRSSLQYLDRFRLVLHGRDLYTEAVESNGIQPDAEKTHDWDRENLLYSLNLHQVYLGRLKPALHDFVTFYLPRLILQKEKGLAPATAEEAVLEYQRNESGDTRSMPREMLEKYRGEDLDGLIKKMAQPAFRESWPLLRKGLYHGQGGA